MKRSPKYCLGRRLAPDCRDYDYLLRAHVRVIRRRSKRTSRYWFDGGYWGNQGQTPQCVGFAWVHWLEDGPVPQSGKTPCINPSVLYREAQKVDEWPGEDYDGTSVRAAAKVLQSRGYVRSYGWAFDLATIIDTVLEVGPMVLGINWYTGMFSPDANGIIALTGELAGGHAIVVNGVNLETGLARLKQSWGRAWGVQGRCWIRLADLRRLIEDENGEACRAMEIGR